MTQLTPLDIVRLNRDFTDDGPGMEANLKTMPSLVPREMREARQGHKGMAFWLTGLSGAGKTSLAHALESSLFHLGFSVLVLDGDTIRSGLNQDLDFSQSAREENNRRIAELAKLLVHAGNVCLCAFISPTQAIRDSTRAIIGAESFREIFIACPMEECIRRDVKGFYAKAHAGTIKEYTGIASPYEAPHSPDMTVHTDQETLESSSEQLLQYILIETAFQRPKTKFANACEIKFTEG